MRAHYRNVVQDTAGNISPGAAVAVYQPGTTTPITGTLYSDGTSGTTLSNPFTSGTGAISFYLASPQRVDIGVTPAGGSQAIFRDIDVPSTDSGSTISVVSDYGADPTGTADSTSAFASALANCPQGGAVTVPPGSYKISGQLVIPAGVQLRGVLAYRAQSTSLSRLTASSSFSGASMIAFAAAVPCGSIENLALDGTSLPGGTVDGIDCVGACKQGSILGMNIGHFTGHGINITASGGNNPDGWYMHEISSHDNTLDGIHWDYSVDGQLDLFHLDHNGGSGLTMGTMNNCTISNGKAQQNTNYGYALTGGFVKSNSTFTACFSENNSKDGWNFNTSGGGQGSIQLVGCSTRDDGVSGASGSGYSGFVFQVAHADILLVGCSNYVTASSAGPDYGLKLTNCTGNVNIDSCSLIGGVAPWLSGGGNTLVRWNGSTVSTGQSDGTRTIAQAPANPAAFQPANPTGTVSTTQVMMGLGATCAYTPGGSGNVLVTITGYTDTSATGSTAVIGARFGTGTAPANGVAVTGTRFGGAADQSLRASAVGAGGGFAIAGRLTGLTPGTAIWLDLALSSANGTSTNTVKSLSVTVAEQP